MLYGRSVKDRRKPIECQNVILDGLEEKNNCKGSYILLNLHGKNY